MTVNLAMIANGDMEVMNTIVADSVDFKIDGYTLIPILGKQCEIGMFYNKKDGLFYFDKGFKLSTNPVADPSQTPLEDN